MIIDLQRFVEEERPYWKELEQQLQRLEAEPVLRLSIEELTHFHYLYERTSAGLGKIITFSSEPQLREYLESLVSRAYSEIHSVRQKTQRFSPFRWFFRTFPQTFRRHFRLFVLATVVTLLGSSFGGFILMVDPDEKAVIMPFGHLLGDPSERVRKEEQAGTEEDRLKGVKSRFSAYLMENNIRVSFFTLASGIVWGIGTLVILFYNGVILGAVAVDYVLAGELKFLLGWLMPHGVIEIPAILIAGQAGFLLGSALIGWGNRQSLRMRLRQISNDLVTLIAAVALFLVWAGLIESFLSQYHEPVIPYAWKIGFGSLEFGLLVFFLSWSGRKQVKPST